MLVVEDEAYVRDSLVEILRARGFDASAAATVKDALELLSRAPVDVVLSDLRMPGEDGLELVRRMQSATPDVPVLILTGHGTVASAVECLKAGAIDYVLKPVEPDALELALERALEGRALRREVRYLRGAVAGEGAATIGESAPWRRAIAHGRGGGAGRRGGADHRRVGHGQGAAGAAAARPLRAAPRAPSSRSTARRCRSRCGRASSSATARARSPAPPSDRDGRFQLADRGTLLLDEVGAMPAAGQAKLLRAIQDGEFERLGDEQATRVDVRVVASTNSDLEAEVQQGRFRADLFYRLNVVRIDGAAAARAQGRHPAARPPLRRRRSRRGSGGRRRSSSPRRSRGSRAYHWPGNVRELRNVIERAMILDPAHGLEALDLAQAGAALAARGRGPRRPRPQPARVAQPARARAAARGAAPRRAACASRRRTCWASTRATSPTTCTSTASPPTAAED